MPDAPEHCLAPAAAAVAVAIAAAMALAVYVATLAPGLTFEHHGVDGGDLIAAAGTLGVPHPSGYPTYTLLAWLASHLQVGTVAYRVNLLSAVCAAVAVGFLCRSVQLLMPAGERSPVLPVAAAVILPVAAALTLAFSSLFWSQAVISEVYALLALFAAVLLWLLVRWRQGGADWYLWLAALVLGLGLGNHLTLVFAVPAAAILLWERGGLARQRWLRPRTLLPALAFLVAGLAIYAYLPLAAAGRPPVNWGNPQTWERFLWVVTAEQYQGFAFGLAPEQIPGRLSAWAALLGDQFGWWGLAIALAGVWWLWQRDRRLALFALVWALLAGVYAFFYDTNDAHMYLLPVFVLMALAWGEGARYLVHLGQRLGPAWRGPVLAAILALPLLSLALHWQDADLSGDWFAQAYMYQVLEAVEPEALVVVRGDRATFALWYGVYAEGRRPDVAVVSGPLLAYTWYRDNVRYLYPDLVVKEPTADEEVTTDDLVRDLIEQNYTQRPVYATDPSEAWEAWFDFVEEEAPIYRASLKGESSRGVIYDNIDRSNRSHQGLVHKG